MLTEPQKRFCNTPKLLETLIRAEALLPASVCEIHTYDCLPRIEFLRQHEQILLMLIEITQNSIYVTYKDHALREVALLVGEDIKAIVIDQSDIVVKDFSDT